MADDLVDAESTVHGSMPAMQPIHRNWLRDLILLPFGITSATDKSTMQADDGAAR